MIRAILSCFAWIQADCCRCCKDEEQSLIRPLNEKAAYGTRKEEELDHVLNDSQEYRRSDVFVDVDLS